jgi:hypothetical protein
MKQLACLLVTLCLVSGILLVAVADVNHGHGPGYHAGDGHGSAYDNQGSAHSEHVLKPSDH